MDTLRILIPVIALLLILVAWSIKKIKPLGKWWITGIVIALFVVFKLVNHDTKLSMTISSPEVIASESGQLALSISGSSVINDSLAPSLVRAYMSSLNYTDITTVVVDKKQKTILGTLDGKRVSFSIKSPGTKDGFLALNNKTADVCMASAQGEKEFRDVTIENVIGLDGIAVVTNASNPIAGIDKNTLNKIFSGEIKTWSDVKGSTSTGNIIIYRMGDKTGIYKMFSELVMNKKEIGGTAFEKSKEMVAALAKDKNGIGFVSYTFLATSSEIKEIPISDGNGISAIPPNALTISSEKYPLCRRLYMYRPNTAASNNANGFTRFVSSEAGQKIVESVGFINLTIKTDNTVEIKSSDPQSYKNVVASSEKNSTEFRFDFGSEELDSRGLDDMDRLVAYLSQPQYRGKAITLVGFTDNVGSDISNLSLSKKRADKVAKRLLDDKGITVANTIGMGKLRPARDNGSEQSRAFNRRVEIWIAK